MDYMDLNVNCPRKAVSLTHSLNRGGRDVQAFMRDGVKSFVVMGISPSQYLSVYSLHHNALMNLEFTSF